MADFKQAIEWLREGKKVRRKCTSNPFYKIFLSKELGSKDFVYMEHMKELKPKPHNFQLEEFEATDWEIYLEKRICSVEGCNEEAKYILIPGHGMCFCHAKPLMEAINDKEFKELFGFELPKKMHEEITERKDYFKEKVESAFNCCIDCEKSLEECNCKKEKTLSDKI